VCECEGAGISTWEGFQRRTQEPAPEWVSHCLKRNVATLWPIVPLMHDSHYSKLEPALSPGGLFSWAPWTTPLIPGLPRLPLFLFLAEVLDSRRNELGRLRRQPASIGQEETGLIASLLG